MATTTNMTTLKVILREDAEQMSTAILAQVNP